MCCNDVIGIFGIDRDDLLRFAVLQQREIFFLEIADEVAITVAHRDVDQNQFCFGTQREFLRQSSNEQGEDQFLHKSEPESGNQLNFSHGTHRSHPAKRWRVQVRIDRPELRGVENIRRLYSKVKRSSVGERNCFIQRHAENRCRRPANRVTADVSELSGLRKQRWRRRYV